MAAERLHAALLHKKVSSINLCVSIAEVSPALYISQVEMKSCNRAYLRDLS